MATADHTIRLSADTWRRLQRLAEREGVTPDVAAERAVERALVEPAPDASSLATPADRAPSALERAGVLIGSVEGPGDLSSREGFGS